MINTLSGAANGQLPQWNDPDLLEDINNVFPEIANSTDLPQYTKEGKKIVGRKVTGIVPVEGGQVAIQMDVTDEDGNTYSAPLTRNRTHDESDNVAVMGISELSNRLNLINQGREDTIFQETARYMDFGNKKNSSKPNLQKEQYAAENKIAEDYRKQIAELDTNPTYLNDPEGKRARMLEIEQARDQEMAQVRLRASNILGGNDGGGLVNLEGQQREKKITQTMDLFKQAFPKIEFTPELNAKIRSAIDQGKDQEWISEYIADYANSQDSNTTKPNQSQSENADEIRGWIYDQRGQGSRSKYSETPTNLSAKERAGLARYTAEGESTSKSYRPEDVPKGNDARTGRGLDAIQMWNN